MERLRFLTEVPLFSGIGEEELPALFKCLEAREHGYDRGEFILRAGDPARYVGVVRSGGVQVCREDAVGNRVILAGLEAGQMFGEGYACAGAEALPVSVLAVLPSRVLLLNCTRIITPCASACAFHTRLIANLMAVLAQKNVFLTQRLEHLSKRTLREKLLSYLGEQPGAEQGYFSIPFDRQGLADYLCADRSALSRELGKLRREGILACDRNRFWFSDEWLE